MTYAIEEIEGIGLTQATKLAEAHIETTEDLLTLCRDAQGRKAVAQKTGVSETKLLKWSNLADLMRVSGIGPQFSELLEAAGVDTIKELRARNAETLAAKMKEVNEAKHLAKASPPPKTIEGWINSAKKMEPTITY
jgi:predicted flap endonuclease-1-like 5' DNA nuclease